ncbi:MAG: sulfur transfer protein SirA [Chloroflexi bacterium ADurb.Bin325]|nr:MAG: sulfur transfer protein SirA [Chloroflexi bacterium ADurb.Bin325]
MTDIATPTAAKTLDNRGSNCAAGFVQLLEMMESLAAGETLAILSTDPASQRELREWAARSGNTLLQAEAHGPFWRREYHYLVRKEAAA